MSIIVFGDLHLNDERPWSLEAGKALLDYFKNDCADNNDNNIGVFLGDITEKASISPLVYEMLFSLLSNLRFKRTYILSGNHDRKRKKGKLFSPLSFLQLEDSPYKNIRYITNPELYEEEGIPLIFLPFRSISEEPNMSQYVEGLDSSWYLMKNAKIFGHFTDTSNTSLRDNFIDVTKFQGEIILGHIHMPLSPNYVGSVVPNSITEKGIERYYRVYSKSGSHRKVKLPSIIDYFEVTFPEPIVAPTCKVPVFTVLNCQSVEAAVNLYPDFYIKKCIYENLVDTDSFSKAINFSDEKSLVKVIEGWLGEQKTLADPIKEKVKKYLQTN